MVRWILIRMAVILVVLALLIVACAAPAPEVIEREVIVEKEVPVTVEVEKEKIVEKKVVETVVVEKEVVVTFMSWATNDFEMWALRVLVNRFEETQGIRVDWQFER